MSEMGNSGGGGTSARDQGVALLRSGDFAGAASALREAVEADPSDEAAWRYLGGALASSGDSAQAVQAFERAVSLSPASAKNRFNVAQAYQANGQMYEARASLQKAVELDPNYEQARTRLEQMESEAEGAASAAAGVAVTPTAPPPMPPPAPIGGMGAIGGGAPPPPAPPRPSAPVGLSPVGGGLSPVGGLSAVGGDTSAPPPPPPSGGATVYGTGGGAPGGMASVGGGAGQYGATPPLNPVPAYSPPPPGGSPNPYGAPTPVLGQQYALQNTSGQKGDVPAEVGGGWNWGAFYFQWLWAFVNGATKIGGGVLAFQVIPYIFLSILSARSRASGGGAGPVAIFGLLYVAGLIFIPIYLGINGNKIAWRNRAFPSVENFKDTQRIWAWWVLGVFVVNFVIGIASFGFIVAMVAAAAGGAGRGGVSP